MTVSRPILTSLLLVEERLLEAEYFARLMCKQGPGGEFGYCLNAFVSAARSVSFLVQKEMARVPGFDVWWEEQREILGADPAARFFLKMRNFSQKEGKISLVGSASSGPGKVTRWTYRFAGTSERVPLQLLKRDVADCCMEHVGKLARVVLACTERFPYHSCPRRAMTPEGIAALDLKIESISAALGFGPEYVEVARKFPLLDQLRFLCRNIDGLDFETLKRLSQLSVSHSKVPVDSLGGEWADLVVDQLEQYGFASPMNAVAAMLLRRGAISDINSGPAENGSANK